MGRSGWEARSFLVLRLYVSNAVLKMDAKLDCEVDVEGEVGAVGTVDMVVRGEEGASISRRLACALIQSASNECTGATMPVTREVLPIKSRLYFHSSSKTSTYVYHRGCDTLGFYHC